MYAIIKDIIAYLFNNFNSTIINTIFLVCIIQKPVALFSYMWYNYIASYSP